MPWEWPVGAVCAFVLALVTTPAGVSGAVLLLPIQLSVLHVPSPAVTPTNLLFNVAAVPGGLLRFWHERRLLNQLTWLLVSGTLPGVIVGRDHSGASRCPEAARFKPSPSGVLLPLGLWLALGSQRLLTGNSGADRLGGTTRIWLLVAGGVGTVGGIYGIGGGSILAPDPARAWILGFYEVAPATLTATFLTSIGGILDLPGTAGHSWRCDRTGLSLGCFSASAGLPAATSAPGLQRHLPERSAATPARTDRMPRRGPLRPDQHPTVTKLPADARHNSLTTASSNDRQPRRVFAARLPMSFSSGDGKPTRRSPLALPPARARWFKLLEGNQNHRPGRAGQRV